MHPPMQEISNGTHQTASIILILMAPASPYSIQDLA